MKHGSLFSGIGGFDLAAEWMGWENMFHCEINPFCQKILRYYWPQAKQYHDIKTTDFTQWRGCVDVLTGGFPCQPYSNAGKRKGKEDDRHLWPEMLRAIREISPRWILGENVRGLTNWNGGVVFDEVQADLEAEGYEVTPFLLPACGVNAPHRRDRIWFVAYAGSTGGFQYGRSVLDGIGNDTKQKQRREQQSNGVVGSSETSGITANAESLRINRTAELENDKGQSGERRGCDADNVNEISSEDGATADTGLQRQKISEKQTTGIEQCDKGDVANPENVRHEQPRGTRERRAGFKDGDKSTNTNTGNKGLQGSKEDGNVGDEGENWNQQPAGLLQPDWEEFPTQSPVCERNDGLPYRVDRYISNEFYESIKETNKVKDLSEVWKRISQEEVWGKIRRFYSLESKEILFQTMQLYQEGAIPQINISPFSQEFQEPILRNLRKYGEFAGSPQGQRLEKQRSAELKDIMRDLPHEVALAARRFEAAITKFKMWHRNESIKGFGNAIVPQVVYQIFKAIEQYESLK